MSLKKLYKVSQKEIFSSIMSGFEVACMNGPLVGEEMLGACFVVDEIEVADKKQIDFLM